MLCRGAHLGRQVRRTDNVFDTTGPRLNGRRGGSRAHNGPGRDRGVNHKPAEALPMTGCYELLAKNSLVTDLALNEPLRSHAGYRCRSLLRPCGRPSRKVD
jgi:hypothetical protein